MGKIRAYYSTLQTLINLMSSAAFDLYISNDPDFWMSTYGNNDYALLLVNGDDRDHTKISNQAGFKTADFDDIRSGINDPTDSAIITKAVNNLPSLDFSDFDSAASIRDIFTIIIQHLQPGHCSLSFDNQPRPSGTFTDDFTDTDDVFLQDHTPSGGGAWALGKDGLYSAQIEANALTFRLNGGDAGLSYWTNTDQGSADQYVQAELLLFTANDEDIYLATRLVDEDNFIGYHNAGTGAAGSRLAKKVTGTLTDSIISTQGAVGYLFKIECEGSTVRFFRDTGGGFTQVGSDQTITDHQTETSSGIVAGDFTGDAPLFDNYENGTVGGGLTLNLSDTITLSDALINGIGLNKEDSISLFDNFLKSIGLNKNETINLTDIISKEPSIQFSDTINMTDVFNALITFLLSLNDTIAMSDSISNSPGLNKSDSIAMSDNISNVVGFIRSFSDTINLTDVISKETGMALSDSITMSDAFNAIITLILSLSDTITMSDTIIKQPGLNKADTISMADSLSKVSAFVRTFSDQIDMSDDIAKNIGITKADIITMADNFSTSTAVIYALINFLAKTKNFNFNAKNKTFNFTAKNKSFNFDADPRGKKP